MKTAEEFLSHAEERLMLLKIFGYTPKEDQIKDLCKIMEQFRKEGIEEIKPIIECLEDTGAETYPEGVYARVKAIEFLREWYNNQIKEA